MPISASDEGLRERPVLVEGEGEPLCADQVEREEAGERGREALGSF